MQSCPLCLNGNTRIFYSDPDVNWTLYTVEPTQPDTRHNLDFYQCDNCDLVFKDRRFALPLDNQKTRYLEHQNILSEGYTNFLNKLWIPLRERLQPQHAGLDYGCGPTQAFGELAKLSGFKCSSYDPIFWPRQELLEQNYDFVFCSEVAEHFVNVNVDWKQLKKLLKPNGRLGVMTGFVRAPFASWHYHRDPTHISFYSAKTFEWISQWLELKLVYCQNDVALFQGD